MGCPVKVTVYSKPKCVQCDATKRALDQRALPYQVIDLTQDPEALEFVTRLGHRSAPVVVIEADGQLLDHWAGYIPAKIAAL